MKFYKYMRFLARLTDHKFLPLVLGFIFIFVGSTSRVFADGLAPAISDDTNRWTDSTFTATHIVPLVVTDVEDVVTSVEFQEVGDLDWTACAAEDGAFDETSENVFCTVPTPDVTGYNIIVRATDASDNTTAEGFEFEASISRSAVVDNKIFYSSIGYFDDPDYALDVYEELGFGPFANLVGQEDISPDAGWDDNGGAVFANNAYAEFPDINSRYNFAGADAQFKVEAYVKAVDFAAGDTKIVVTKVDDSNNELWFMGVDGGGGLMCGIYTDGYEFFETGLLDPDPVFLTNDAWNKIACSYDESTSTLKGYIDDVEVYELVHGGNSEIPASDSPVYINGYPPTGDGGFNGGIDDVTIYNSAGEAPPPPPDPTVTLSMTVDSEYSVTEDFSFQGNALTNVNNVQTVQWRPHVDGQGAEVAWSDCSADDAAFDELNEDFTCTATSGAVDGTFYYDIRAKDTENTVSVSSVVSGLLDTAELVDVWFNFDNTTDAGIHPGSGRIFGAVTPSGSPVLATGENGDGAISFDGLASVRYNIEDTSGILDHADDDTTLQFSVRVKPDAALNGSYATLVAKSDNGDTDQGWWDLVHTPDGYAQFRIGVESTILNFGNATYTSLNYDAWNDILVKVDFANRVVNIKVNDNDTDTATWLLADDIRVSLGDITLGGAYDGNQSLVGDLDDVVIYRQTDAAPPVISIESMPNSDRITDSTPSFNVTFTDETGIASAEYYFSNSGVDVPGGNLDDQSWVAIDAPDDLSWGGTSETYTITAPELAEGNWNLFIRAVDVAGLKTNYPFGDGQNWTNFNESSAYSLPYYNFTTETVDSTAPQIYSNSVLPNPTIDRQPAIRGYVKDYSQLGVGDTISSIASISYSVDGDDFTLVTEPVDGIYDSSREDFYIQIPDELAPGAHTIQIRAEDSEGNNTSANDVDSLNGDDLISFTVTDAEESDDPEDVVLNITFDDRDLQDSVFSDAVWGNGRVRLRQEIEFATTVDYVPDTPYEFGYPYGEVSVSIYPSVDGNLWVSTNDGGLIYYNTETQTATKYDPLRGGVKVTPFEFEYADNRYLLLNYESGYSTFIYDLNNTPEDTSDDPAAVDYEVNAVNLTPTHDSFSSTQTDTRDGAIAVFGISESGEVVRVDLEGTPMDVSDDTITVWGEAEGIGVDEEGGNFAGDFTGFLFDQATNTMLIGSYDRGIFILDDNGTPEDKGDDTVGAPFGYDSVSRVFSIIKDPNGYYWFGGDNGLHRTDINGTADQADDDFVTVVTSAQMSNEAVAKIQWVDGDEPVGDEVWMTTRSGRLRAIEFNFTYDDSLDDTLYSYKIPQFESNAGGATTFYITDRNTIWNAVKGAGILKTALTRGFEDSNTIEIYPTPPSDLLEVDEVLLSSVLGSVSAGSLFSFDDLVTYEISNDAGLTWTPISVGSTLNFEDSDYKLKLRITLTAGSTPIIDSLQLAYVAQPQGTIAAGQNPPAGSSNGTVGNTNTYQGGNLVPSCGNAAPTKAPWLYGAIAQGSDSVMLYFAPAEGPVDRYVLEYGTESGNAIWGSSYIGGSDARSYLVSALPQNTKVYFRVRAGNGCATGPWSDEISATTGKSSFFNDKVTQVINEVVELLTPEVPGALAQEPATDNLTGVSPTLGETISENLDSIEQATESPRGRVILTVVILAITLLGLLLYKFLKQTK